MEKTNEDKGSIKKPLYKKWWFWVIIVIGLSTIFGNMESNDEGTSNTATTTGQVENQSAERTEETKTTEDVSKDKFVKEVKTAIQGAISSKDESVTDVVLKDGDLCVYVDFSKTDPSPLTLEDLALSRTSSITDVILELKDYDSLWETITVDFGETGHITNNKADIENNGFGRYFPADDFKLE